MFCPILIIVMQTIRFVTSSKGSSMFPGPRGNIEPVGADGGNHKDPEGTKNMSTLARRNSRKDIS